MKTTAGIMPSLQSIAWANGVPMRCKACLSTTLQRGREKGGAQGLGVTGAGLTVAVPGSEVVWYWHWPQDSYCLPQKSDVTWDTRPLTARIMTALYITNTTFKLFKWLVFIVTVWNGYFMLNNEIEGEKTASEISVKLSNTGCYISAL